MCTVSIVIALELLSSVLEVVEGIDYTVLDPSYSFEPRS